MAIPPIDLLQHAVALRSVGRASDAERVAREALRLNPVDPKIRWALATALLTQGRYDEGLPLLAARHAAFGHFRPQLPYPEWKGEAVRQLLIWPEQGYGDQIQIARFAAVLARDSAVTWLTPQPLARLFRASLPVEIVEVQQSITFPDPDAWAMSFEIPAHLGISRPEDVPSVPYLCVPDEARARWRGFTTDARSIGFAWRGNPSHGNDAQRSMPSPDLFQALSTEFTVHDLTIPVGDFADTAAIVDQMDLIISVDTALAHLAGALGKPCWLLLPAEEVDWRWMYDRSDSPWYPSMRIFRQEAPGDWASVMQRVIGALRT